MVFAYNYSNTAASTIIFLALLTFTIYNSTGMENENTEQHPTPIPGSALDLPALTPTPTPFIAFNFRFPLGLGTANGSGYGHTSSSGYGVQNPYLGSDGKCFVNIKGTRVPWRDLYHAGTDWFYLLSPTQTANTDVVSIGNGTVIYKAYVSYPGWVVIIEHKLPDGTTYYSQYGHLTMVTVEKGDTVFKGDKIGTVLSQGDNSHLHWEVRSFGLANNLYPPSSAGGRGTRYPPTYKNCNRDYGVGYNWDDISGRLYPDYWGYTHPEHFVSNVVFLPLSIKPWLPTLKPTQTLTPRPTITPTPSATKTRTSTPTVTPSVGPHTPLAATELP